MNEHAQAVKDDQLSVPKHVMHAFTLLNLPLEATAEQIQQAFRARVKGAFDGQGGYNEDMDRLVQAKEHALAFRQRSF